MAENTKQYEQIVTIKGGLDVLFADDPLVFIAADLFWYPVEGDNKTCTAPDTLVVFGRPKGDRRSYLQWLEDDIPPQVVFEVLSPGNRPVAMLDKLKFYEEFGVEEYYIYDPDDGSLRGFLRANGRLLPIDKMEGWTSPRLKVRFHVRDGKLEMFGPDGRLFVSYLEQAHQREAAEKWAEESAERADLAELERDAVQARLRVAEEQKRVVEEQKRIAEEQKRVAEEQVLATEERARLAEQLAQQLAARLKALGIDPDTASAS